MPDKKAFEQIGNCTYCTVRILFKDKITFERSILDLSEDLAGSIDVIP